MNEYRQNIPRQPDRNMIDPTRVDRLVGDMRHATLIDALGLPTDYGDLYPLGHPEPKEMTAVSWVAIVLAGAIAGTLVAVVLLLAFPR